MQFMQSKTLHSSTAISVSELNRQARNLLERSFLTIQVEGELSNFVRPSSGHWYFTLKDDKAQVRCAMFRNRNQLIRPQPKNGDKVRVAAKVSLYEGRGDYQLICEHLQPAGSGSLQAAFDALKLKLQQAGLFANEHKKTLPAHPRHVGIITSATGAAVHDILNVLKRRAPALQVTIYPTAVQGEDAADQICRALLLAEAHQSCDVLIIGRGGGSQEDLWSFNSEKVAHAVFDCQLPIISAVGHEVDVVITDFVADVRAPTPSAAAELISPDQQQLSVKLKQLEQRLFRQLKQTLRLSRNQLENLQSRLRHPTQHLKERAQQLDHLELRLITNIQKKLAAKRNQHALIENRLYNQKPEQLILQRREQIRSLHTRLNTCIQSDLQRTKLQLRSLMAQLHTVSPLATLERGYAIAKDDQGRVIHCASQSQVDDTISVQLHDGNLTCTINEVNSEETL